MCIPCVCRLCGHVNCHILLLLNLLFTYWIYVHVCVCVLNSSGLISKPTIITTCLTAHLRTTSVNFLPWTQFHPLHYFCSANRQLGTFSQVCHFDGLTLKKWHICHRYVTLHYSEDSVGTASVTPASQLPASTMLLLVMECAQRLPRMRRYVRHYSKKHEWKWQFSALVSDGRVLLKGILIKISA